jgi:glutamine amidotransferase
VAAGIGAAVRWIAARLPVYSLNFVMATEHELWAFRYPDNEPLYLLERDGGGYHGGRALHHASDRLRVHVPQLADQPSMIVASERLDENPAWRLLESGELVHVDAELRVESSRVLTQPPERVLRFRRTRDSSG